MLTATSSYKTSKYGLALGVAFAALAIMAIAAYAVRSLPLSFAAAAMLILMAPFVYGVLPKTRQWILGAMLFFYPLNVDETRMLQPSPGGADGFALDMVDILMVMLFVITLIRSSRSKQLGELQFFPSLMLPSLAMLVMMAISLVNAQDLLWSGFDLFNMAKTILFFFLLANNIRSPRDLHIVLLSLFAGVVVQTSIAAAVNINPQVMEMLKSIKLGGSEQVEIPTSSVSDFFRSGGTLGNANHLGRYYGLVLPIAMALAITKTHVAMGRVAALISAIGLLGVINTLSRSAWLGIAFSFMMTLPLILIYRHFTLRSFVKIATAALFGLVVLVILWEPIYERLTRPDNGSANTRITTAKVALRIIEDHPFIEIGRASCRERVCHRV